jgi:hypothetical protein
LSRRRDDVISVSVSSVTVSPVTVSPVNDDERVADVSSRLAVGCGGGSYTRHP